MKTELKGRHTCHRCLYPIDEDYLKCVVDDYNDYGIGYTTTAYYHRDTEVCRQLNPEIMGIKQGG